MKNQWQEREVRIRTRKLKCQVKDCFIILKMKKQTYKKKKKLEHKL